jgi:hypothetical protein
MVCTPMALESVVMPTALRRKSKDKPAWHPDNARGTPCSFE